MAELLWKIFSITCRLYGLFKLSISADPIKVDLKQTRDSAREGKIIHQEQITNFATTVKIC